MKKLTNLFLMLLLSVSTMFAANIVGGTKLYFTPSTNWADADARFAAYFYGTEGSAWASLALANEEGPVYQVAAPAGTWTNVIFCRMNPADNINSWGNKWNQTDDLIYDGVKNYYVRAEGAWDGAGGTWGVYVDPISDPEVYISAPSFVYDDETITLSATSANVEDPEYVFYVKTPGADEFEWIDSPYQPNEVGIYEFMVELWNTSALEALATDFAEVLVKTVPAPVTITVNISNTGWEELAIWNWSAGIDGNFVVATETAEAGIYEYTFERREALGLIFVESDGTTWPADLDFDTRMGRQTVNAEGIVADACFIIGAQQYVDGSQDYAKRAAINVDCADINAPMVELVAPYRVYVDETIVLMANSLNVEEPLYEFYVKAPGADDFEWTDFVYEPEIAGTYEFKVELWSPIAIDPLATATGEVLVLDVPEDITITVDISATGWSEIAIWYWSYGNFGQFVVPTEVSAGIYEYTFERIDELGLIFVEGDGIVWPEEGEQTVDVAGITASACYVVGDLDELSGKREVEECAAEAAPRAKAAPSIAATSDNLRIDVTFKGTANVEVYTISGIRLTSQVAEDYFSYPVNERGAYIIRVNDEVQKVMVK